MTLGAPGFLAVPLGVALACAVPAAGEPRAAGAARPNVLLCIADDWGWPHAGVLGDEVVRTPHFDRLAREGVLFTHAFVSSPACTPSRNALLTGQDFWRLGPGANLWSTLDPDHAVFPLLLAEAGYHVGHWRKSWGPGRLTGWETPPAGPAFEGGFEAFLAARPEGAPFCFWLGSSDPHRPYREGSGVAGGLDPDAIDLFPFFPDLPRVRSDVADYYHEVERFDRDVGEALARLEALGELENTLVVVTGDHGMPFPRCKGNIYDSGTRVPLALRWPARAAGRRVLDDLVSLTDLAPTFLAAAGLPRPAAMTGRDLGPCLAGGERTSRTAVVLGRERHTQAQEAGEGGGYPVRALRTRTHLYVRNLRPGRWPAGTPNHERAFRAGAWLADCDNGPTKWVIAARAETDETCAHSFELCFARRPAEELYDLTVDPHQLRNLAAVAGQSNLKARLAQRLAEALEERGDPRSEGMGAAFDRAPYFGGTPSWPGEAALGAFR
ncbi:MAG: sulfatase [Planctomycetota bacterium]|nr:sulfatase [Planctomycetota bacterium]